MMTYVLYLALIILSVADYWTTFIILSQGGVEKNPVVNWFIKRWGIKLGVVYVKALPIIALGCLVFLYPIFMLDYLIAIVALYCLVVWHNYTEIK